MAKSTILWGPNSNPKHRYLGLEYKGLDVCRNNGWLMKNMDKALTVPNWVLINRPKITQNLFAQKFGISMKKSLHWASVVCALKYSFRKTIDCCYEKKVVANSKEGEVLNSNVILCHFLSNQRHISPEFQFCLAK